MDTDTGTTMTRKRTMKAAALALGAVLALALTGAAPGSASADQLQPASIQATAQAKAKKSIKNAKVTGLPDGKTYKGGGHHYKVNPKVKLGGKTLKLDRDYKMVVWRGDYRLASDYDCKGFESLYKRYRYLTTSPGTHRVVITGIGAYKGKITKEFTIKPAHYTAADIKIAAIPPQPYTGKKVKPKTRVTTRSGITLGEDNDFVFHYKNNVKAGTATLVVRLTDKCGGYKVKKTKTFKIYRKGNKTYKYVKEKVKKYKTYKACTSVDMTPVNKLKEAGYSDKSIKLTLADDYSKNIVYGYYGYSGIKPITEAYSDLVTWPGFGGTPYVESRDNTRKQQYIAYVDIEKSTCDDCGADITGVGLTKHAQETGCTASSKTVTPDTIAYTSDLSKNKYTTKKAYYYVTIGSYKWV